MADYIYLLENRLSPAQLRALSTIRNAARANELTLFLTGGAVRDLTGGGSVRDLDFTVQGDATTLKAVLESAGGVLDGEHAEMRSLFFTFPGGVRTEISSAMAVTFPKPGKPEYRFSSIIEDLRSRDFTANAMALSLNEGSYGLLMDPVNGIADIENRELRLVSNYGFLENPALMIRAVRLGARLGFHMEERTQQRYNDAKEAESISALSKYRAAYELEEIFHEEDPLRTIRALGGEGWLQVLSPALQALKPNDAALNDLRDKQGQLQTQGILADSSALAFPLLTSKMPQAEIDALKAGFARPGFAREIDTLEERTKDLQTRFSGKEAAVPSSAWHMLHDSEPSLVLSMYVSVKSGNIPARLKTFLTDSPNARQRIPYATLQEMRITPDLPGYAELLDKLFFELMDGKLSTPEELKAYLEPYSPPAPPPTVNLRRARAKKEARPSRAKAKKAATVTEQEEATGIEEGILEPGTLTGPDRGTEPSNEKPLEGTVAPLATEDTGTEAQAREDENPRTPATENQAASKAVSADKSSKAAKKLSAKPEKLAREEADKDVPHPAASKSVAAKGKVTIPQVSAPAKTAASVAPAKPSKQAPAKDAPAVKKAIPVAAKGKAPGKGDATAQKQASAKAVPATKSQAKAAPAKPAATKQKEAAVVRGKSAPVPAKTSTPSKAAPVKATKTAAKTPSKIPAKAVPGKSPVKKSAKR